jgi:N-acetylmuramoyl-L-alanine amidase
MTLSWDVRILACTLFGEARGEGPEGIAAVANVITNRLRDGRFGNTVQEVCLRPLQFSCWNTLANMQMLLSLRYDTNPHFRDCVDYANLAIDSKLIDVTGGALFYHTLDVDPTWDDAMTELRQIGHHKFYTDREAAHV